jgi:hypothetical protein
MYVIDAIARSAHATWRKKGESEEGLTSKQILERFEAMFNSVDTSEIFHNCSDKDKVGIVNAECCLGDSVDVVADGIQRSCCFALCSTAHRRISSKKRSYKNMLPIFSLLLQTY